MKYAKEIEDYFFPGDDGISDETEKFIDETDFLEKLYNFLIKEKYADDEDITQYCYDENDPGAHDEIDYGTSVGEWLVFEDDDTIKEIYEKFIKCYE